jgi:hypothetical protein
MNLRQLPLLLGTLLLAACGGNVAVGGGSSNDGGSGGAGQGGAGQGGAEILPAVALTRAEMDVLWEEYWESQDPSGGTTSSGGGDLDPSDLFLRYSDMGVSCGSPYVELPCGGHYQVTLVLPPALQQVGVYDLEDPLLIAYSSISETGDLYSNDPQDCSFGGGSTGPGTLEILSIDASQVHFKVTLADGFWESATGGDFVAPRCQGIL